MIEKQPADRIVDRVHGTVSGSHLQVHADHVITPIDQIGLFYTTNDNQIGVALQLEDEQFGRMLIQLDAVNAVGLFRLLEQFVTMDEPTLDAFINRVGNFGEAN
jgi:hypothetical protein